MKPAGPGKCAHPVLLSGGREGGRERGKKKTSLPEVPGSLCLALFVVVTRIKKKKKKESFRTWFSLLSHQQVNNYA